MSAPLRQWALPLLLALSSGCSMHAATARRDIVRLTDCKATAPLTLRSDQRIDIQLDVPQPLGFMVFTDQKEWIVMQPGQANASLHYQPPAHFQFSLATLEGDYWHDGQPSKERIFRTPGSYTLYFAENLETEPGNTLSCHIPIEVVTP